ncbi:MAG: AarF/ABC1/UbiB kinase family protein [Proteobacteria bacterium]|nr:AarF/ABC1/UbiB kinase family protein [Pseudomonadota bacterium]MBU1585361.1 AarF/ABC1/UbiB kinase family protein [Pseudomonadota bacterium]MBU2628459.1 AarF/ABC1/UbiB kinase family protein [Pseudomonadota bacterium]
MTDTIPKSKITRTISSGKIAVKMGTNHLGFLIKKPFLSKENQTISQEKKDVKNARILFNGLSLLRGTALKAAQMLSLESDMIPETIRKELEKSYNQVPPINRALVRKIITNNFNAPPENIFESFEATAFAAASLGQVHHARSKDGEDLAVKIQYPDISQTISNDIRLLKTVLRPLPEYAIIKIALEEIHDVLLDETDYEKEGKNIEYFSQNLKNDRVSIPELYSDLTTKNVLSMSFMKGMMLNRWLETRPGRKDRTIIAQTLHDIFIEGFYKLKQIHADPNPGNFIIMDDLKIGLIDFGCVRSFDDEFILLYQKLIRIGAGNDKNEYIDLLTRMKLITSDLDPDIKEEMVALFMKIGDWFSQLFREEEFDFGANQKFMEDGRKIGRQMHRFRKHIHNITPEFIFLDRTRYGLIKLFEKMKVKIRMKNQYEY